MRLILTLEALLTLLFPFDALCEFIGDKDVFKKVQMIVLKIEKERPFEQNLDVIKCCVCSGMFRFYSCSYFPIFYIYIEYIYIEYSYSIRITIENNFYCIPET